MFAVNSALSFLLWPEVCVASYVYIVTCIYGHLKEFYAEIATALTKILL